MDKYKKAFFFVSIVFSVPLCFALTAGLIGLDFMGLAICAVMLILWWGMYFYLKTASKLAFGLSFLLVNLYWWPLLFRSVHRTLYIVENIRIGKAGALPMEYLTRTLAELTFFVSLTFALIFGALAIKSFNKTGKIKNNHLL
jgi:hypothetical protein